MNRKDSLYAQPLDSIASFSFDEKVAKVFPDMIQRSVPGYSTIIAMTGVLANRYAQTQTRCYDLGCSLGASTLSIRHQIEERDCRIVAVDNSEAMLSRCQAAIDQDSSSVPVELQLEDIQNTVVNNASVVVLNFTLQFVPLEQRATLIKTIYNGMCDGGILILSEKFLFEDQHLQALNTDLHHSFKQANGYSDMEISQKRSSIENVLIPETIKAHQIRLNTVGFNKVDVWFQCFNFMSLVAIK